MNRADRIRLLAVLDAMAGEIRRDLKADAAAEFIKEGMAPTWKADGITAAASRTHDRVEIADEDEFMVWLLENHPEWVRTVVVPINPEQIKQYLASLATFGPSLEEDEPMPEPGRSAPTYARVPGLLWVRGGEFKTVSVTVETPVKRELAKLARTALDGGVVPAELRPLFEGRQLGS